jgi:CHAT domain-containing protein
MRIDSVEPEQYKLAVISQLPHCSLFHFAGHGHTNPEDPSQSKLLLLDWECDPLTVADILEMNLREKAPFLAYLASCGTGQILDERFMDESIHLISACQLAGFRHVIGTMWEVDDALGVEMARMTYGKMKDKGMTDESVCLGLHYASRKLRDQWLNKLCKREHEGNLVSKANVKSLDNGLDGLVDRMATEGNVREGGLPRDIVLIEDDEEDTSPAHWVSYVHFGV